MTETRYQRLGREQAERQAARTQRELRNSRVGRARRRKRSRSDEPASPSLDPDGRWMDNLGESPDY